MSKKRLDQLLVDQNLAPSKTRAQALILAGHVWVGDQPATKPGHAYPEASPITVKGTQNPFVSRGGLKLQHALEAFTLPTTKCRALDIGASTGGFTDCLLQAGATHVTAVDVGYGQFDWSLRQDPRVTLFEKTNIRQFSPEQLSQPVDLIVIDVSFISLTKIIPRLSPLLKPAGHVTTLVKPQFEVKRHEVGKKGVVKDETLHQRVLEEITTCFKEHHFTIQGQTPSSLLGPKGNREFFLWAQK
jgi:23S rRNA (cytidine1920-2'-O)/16S rRNA (cytidine1409-2'-O)-methyltransferase